MGIESAFSCSAMLQALLNKASIKANWCLLATDFEEI